MKKGPTLSGVCDFIRALSSELMILCALIGAPEIALAAEVWMIFALLTTTIELEFAADKAVNALCSAAL